MPSDLAVELLKRMGWPEPAESRSLKALMPRPATQYPKVDRALAEVEKEYPGLRGISIAPWDFNDPLTGATDLAQTHSMVPRLPYGPEPYITYSPRLEANKQGQIQGSLAHELRHVMQSDAGKIKLSEGALPYAERPSEIDAYRFQDQYKDRHKIPGGKQLPEDTELFNAIIKAHEGVVDIYNKKRSKK